MALIEINKDLSHNQLRLFGALLFLFTAGACVYLSFKHGFTPALAIVPAVVLVYAAIGMFFDWALRPVFIFVSYAMFPIGWVISIVLFAIVFFLVLTPIGLVMRLLRRDPMTRKRDPSAESYWTEHDPADTMDRYFRQF